MAELGAFFGNPNIQRQGARARALAGQRDVNTLADPRTYAIVQGLLGTAPDQMGLSVLNPDYEKIRKAAEPAFALGLLGQAAPLLAPMTKGLPVGASIQNVGKDLSAIQIGDRTIPVTINRIDKKTGGQLVNVNPSAFDEAFSKTGWQYVGEKGKQGISGRYEKFENFLKDAKSIEASNVSVNKDGGIVFGDGRHRYAVLRDMGLDELPIVMDKESIKNAKKFGYLADSPKTSIAPRQEALDKAQRNASLPVEEGGLGLPKDNTPEMRSEAMGLLDAYHGSKQDITGLFKAGYDDNLAFVTQDPEFASKWIGKGKLNQRMGAEDEMKAAEEIYRQNKYKNTDNALLEKLQGEEFNAAYDKMSAAARAENEREFGTRGNATGLFDTVYPVKVQANKTFNPETDMDVMKEFFVANDIPEKLQDLYAGGNYMMYETKPVVNYLKSKGYDSMRLRESTGDNYPTIAVFNPETVRSRFAAFDPFRRDTETALSKGVAPPDLLAGVLPLGLLADEEQRKKLYELMPSLLGE
jgi:hypothetical protein